MKKRNLWMMAIMAGALAFTAGCGQEDKGQDSNSQEAAADNEAEETEEETESADAEEEKEPVNLLIAAAASLEYSMKDELIPMFQEQYPYITVEGTYDSSGKLQTQIEEGLEADLFFSAATKQMDALKEEGFMAEDSIVDLLENKIVLIVPTGQMEGYSAFEDIAKAATPALGDPASVPAGQYAQEALTNLGLWDQVSQKASFGTNVTEVLNWVSQGSAEAGIVYATDAATQKDKVEVVAQAPEGSLAEPVIYPVGVLEKSQHTEEANLFLEFLQSEEAAQVFEDYGFAMNQ